MNKIFNSIVSSIGIVLISISFFNFNQKEYWFLFIGITITIGAIVDEIKNN